MDNRRWFHPNISGVEAGKLLMEQGQDGSFLARPSQSNPSDFTLSVRRGNEITHIKIQNKGEFYDLYGGEKFASLAEIVHYYTIGGNILTERNGVNIFLKFPLYYVDKTTDRWFHGNIPGREAEKMLLEKGRVGSFLVRVSNSRPGDFVLSIRVADTSITHVMIKFRDGKYDVGGGDKFATLSDLVSYYRQNPMVDISGSIVQLKQPLYATRVNASTIFSRVKDLEGKGKEGFSEEFKRLHIEECRNLDNRRIGLYPENRIKNRYKNILPVDSCRVVLEDGDPSVPGSDYINANYIQSMEDDSELSRMLYIATQGCLPNTIVDFWRMIWYKDCYVIALVTRLFEKGKNKCVQYWPELEEEPLHFKLYNSTLSVRTSRVSDERFYVFREIEITCAPNNGVEEVRTIYQFHFTHWTEMRDPSLILNYLQDITDKMDQLELPMPIVVQCSAGIGRTGTLVVIDMIINQIRTHALDCEIDVPRTIQHVRMCRSGMVQSEQQYKFIYQAIMHFIEMAQLFMRENQKSQKNGREYHNIRYTASFVNSRDTRSNLFRIPSSSSVHSAESSFSTGTYNLYTPSSFESLASSSTGTYNLYTTPSSTESLASSRTVSTTSVFKNSENNLFSNLSLNSNESLPI